MILALDSATPPTAAQAQAAAAAGIQLWNGYLAVRPNAGLLRPWTLAEFEAARIGDAWPVAYVSGWDDPLAVKALAADWQVRPCLDVESGIREDGDWVQGWLDASGAGLYGNLGVHSGRQAAFHILSWYVADPGATWPARNPPAAPCGWQWWNSHEEFGVTVDRCYFDDTFLEVPGMATLDDIMTLLEEVNTTTLGRIEQEIKDINAITLLRDEQKIDAIKAELDTLSQHSDPNVGAAVARIEAALKQA